MKFLVKKEDLFDGIKIVERATSLKPLQPVFLNILIETVNQDSIKLTATDLEFTVSAVVDAQVEEEGKITLPSKTLNEIVSKLANKLIAFEKQENDNIVTLTCQKSKFDIIGISANEFPKEICNIELQDFENFEIDKKIFTNAVKKGGFAAATYEANNLLSGIVCDISENFLEIASTDGNRLAKVKEKIENKENTTKQLIIPAKTLNEFLKMSAYIDEDFVKIHTDGKKIIIKSSKITIISRLLDGQYPKYNQLIPTQTPKEATVKVLDFISAIERASVMVNEKTNMIKINFADNEITITSDTPDAGKSEEIITAEYTSEPLLIAFNYKYLLEALKNMECDEVKVGLNTGLSATVLRPKEEEDFVCLIMPVQIR